MNHEISNFTLKTLVRLLVKAEGFRDKAEIDSLKNKQPTSVQIVEAVCSA